MGLRLPTLYGRAFVHESREMLYSVRAVTRAELTRRLHVVRFELIEPLPYPVVLATGGVPSRVERHVPQVEPQRGRNH